MTDTPKTPAPPGWAEHDIRLMTDHQIRAVLAARQDITEAEPPPAADPASDYTRVNCPPDVLRGNAQACDHSVEANESGATREPLGCLSGHALILHEHGGEPGIEAGRGEGIPYSVEEARAACERNAMDEYHRHLMQFLLAEVERLQGELAAALERLQKLTKVLCYWEQAQSIGTYCGICRAETMFSHQATCPMVLVEAALAPQEGAEKGKGR